MRFSVPMGGVAGILMAATLAGCVGAGGSTPPITPAAATADGTGQVDVRKFIGPDYCPELRVREGTELLRRYVRGHDDDPAQVVWQASIGTTARECLYDTQGRLTIRIGVSGRIIAGPKGGPATVSAPLRIAVVKYQEALLFSEILPLSITIPAQNSTVFSEVKEVTLPSPGKDRDYIIYVGFDDGQAVPIGAVPARQAAPATSAAAQPPTDDIMATEGSIISEEAPPAEGDLVAN